jgi:hypothetical protein
MTDRQALQDFPDTIQVQLHKNIKTNKPTKCAEKAVPVHAHTLYTRDSQPFLNGDTLDKTSAIP